MHSRVWGTPGTVSHARKLLPWQPSTKDATARTHSFFSHDLLLLQPVCDAAAVSHYVAMLEAEMGQPASVETVANLVMQMNYNNKDFLVGALIIAGYDDKEGGQVFGCPIGGTLSKEKWAIDGSGSTFIWGYADATFRSVSQSVKGCTQYGS